MNTPDSNINLIKKCLIIAADSELLSPDETYWTEILAKKFDSNRLKCNISKILDNNEDNLKLASTVTRAITGAGNLECAEYAKRLINEPARKN